MLSNATHTGFKLLNHKPYTAFSVCCTICCDSELPPYSTVCLFAFQREIPMSQLLTVSCRILCHLLNLSDPSSQLLSQELTESFNSDSILHQLGESALSPVCSSERIIGALKTIPYFLLFLTPLRTPLKIRYHTGHMVQILVPLLKIGCLTTAQTHGCASDNGGLADQALNVRILYISRDQKQSRTALVLRIFSSFLQQDLLLHPSDPHHWLTGMPLLHIRAHVLEVMNLMKTLNMDSCVRRRSDGSTTSLIAQSIVHFHMSRHSLRPDLSHPLECMPCFQSSARVNYPLFFSTVSWV
ncbi:hypothetical protein T02_1601 [Trichinella nativa]|uniref:Uncharacterized protein n=1 Tax=Trichinella nativa TaxID=6335 RepID=A0A0V1KU68_9BILA|nr:hypothetical protein T02_1601 [Trichinella nativa]